LLDHEQARVKEAVDAIREATVLPPGETRGRRACDTLVPAHAGQHVNRLVKARLGLLGLNELSELFLGSLIKFVGHFAQDIAGSKGLRDAETRWRNGWSVATQREGVFGKRPLRFGGA